MFAGKSFYLLFATGLALLNNAQTGIISGWTSPVLSVIESSNSTIPTTGVQGSWMATVVPLTSMFVTPLAAASVHFLGRRISLALTVLPFVVCWIMTGLATTAEELIYARAVSGAGMALSYTVTPIYLGEIAPDNLRSSIGLCMNVANNVGVLWIYAIGAVMDIWVSSIICASPALVFLILYRKFLPESPYFLLKQKKAEESRRVLQKLRCGPVDEEFAKMERNVVEISIKDSLLELCRDVRHRRALFVSVGSLFISQFTGGITFIFYAHLIFQRAGDVSANTLSLVKAGLQLVFSVLSAYVVETTGKRPLLIISCVGSSVFMAVEGVYFYLHDNGYDVQSVWWLPLVGMILFNVSQVVGLQPIPIAYLGELFDANIKPWAVCISKIFLAMFVFIVGQLFQILVDSFGNAVPFFVFCAMGVVGLMFVILFVPETRGRSLQEIQYYFEHNTYEK